MKAMASDHRQLKSPQRLFVDCWSFRPPIIKPTNVLGAVMNPFSPSGPAVIDLQALISNNPSGRRFVHASMPAFSVIGCQLRNDE